MGLSLKTSRLKRYKDIALLLLKYGRSDWVKSAGLEGAVAGEPNPEVSGDGGPAQELAADLERLGPTFIKIGQMLSARADLLPPAYIQALSKLQDHIAPFPFQQVEAIVQAELGVKISKAFSHFEAEPMAAASLGQVHRAVMRDGRMVAVKVQRPGVKEQVSNDLEIITEVAELLDKHSDVVRRYGVKDMLEEFRRSVLTELDYVQEAQNLTTLGENLSQFRRIIVPRPVSNYSTSVVLTMEYVHGAKVTALTPIARIDVDGKRLAEALFHAYLKQILVDGFFHADPHPGNIFITNDGKQIAMLDLGMVARISTRMQEKLLQLMLAISDGQSDEAAAIALRIAGSDDNSDAEEFLRRAKAVVEANQTATVQKIEVGRVMMELTRASFDCGVRLPSELTMLGKALLHLDQIGRTLYPDFDPNKFIRRRSMELMAQRMKKSASVANTFSGLLETKDFVQSLPGRLNRIMDRVADNDLSIKVDAIDETHLISGLEKIANRITIGLILAALIVGAAMLMNVSTNFRIFGYPGLAMIFFLSAAAGGLVLVINILIYDVKHYRT